MYTFEEEMLRSERLGVYQGLIISLLRELDLAKVDNSGVRYIREKFEEIQKKTVDTATA